MDKYSLPKAEFVIGLEMQTKYTIYFWYYFLSTMDSLSNSKSLTLMEKQF
jgi:hypothetical protein